MQTKNALLIVVDVQKGFSNNCPDELPVENASKIVPIINKLLDLPWKNKFASQDWHPYNHSSFKDFGGIYPVHCVETTSGADFLYGLNTNKFDAIFRKGFKENSDAYSFLQDHTYLNLDIFSDIFICGICTNICVYETAVQCVLLTNKTIHIIEDACATLILPENNQFYANTVKTQAISIGVKYINSEKVLYDL